jgi:hypothetical protein
MKKILIYSGNPATDAHLHSVNTAEVDKDVAKWRITGSVHIENAIKTLVENGARKGDHVILKATSGFANAGALACGKYITHYEDTFPENGKKAPCLVIEVAITEKFSKPKPCGGRRARHHALFIK